MSCFFCGLCKVRYSRAIAEPRTMMGGGGEGRRQVFSLFLSPSPNLVPRALFAPPPKPGKSALGTRLSLALYLSIVFSFDHASGSIMYWSNRSFNIPHGQPPGHLTFLKIIVQIPPYPGQNAVQMPHTRAHSGYQMPPPRHISQAHK